MALGARPRCSPEGCPKLLGAGHLGGTTPAYVYQGIKLAVHRGGTADGPIAVDYDCGSRKFAKPNSRNAMARVDRTVVLQPVFVAATHPSPDVYAKSVSGTAVQCCGDVPGRLVQ